MEKGRFYFLVDKYFIDFPDPSLMQNKESEDGTVYGRPCFYAFKEKDSEIYWMIPISSKVEKYKEKYREKVAKYGRCDTIAFGWILDQERAFLIQDMCPAIDEYIGEEYNYSIKNHLPVEMSRKEKATIESKAKRILYYVRGGKHLVFPDILKIEKELKSKFK